MAAAATEAVAGPVQGVRGQDRQPWGGLLTCTQAEVRGEARGDSAGGTGAECPTGWPDWDRTGLGGPTAFTLRLLRLPVACGVPASRASED